MLAVIQTFMWKNLVICITLVTGKPAMCNVKINRKLNVAHMHAFHNSTDKK